MALRQPAAALPPGSPPCATLLNEEVTIEGLAMQNMHAPFDQSLSAHL
jgi:hypothetical protein